MRESPPDLVGNCEHDIECKTCLKCRHCCACDVPGIPGAPPRNDRELFAARKSHISHTQLAMYWRCAEQYRRRYPEGEKLPPGIAQLTGGAVHKGAQTNFDQKIESHEDLPASEIMDASADAFEEATKGGYSLSQEEASTGREKVLSAAKEQTVRLAKVHAIEQAPDYQPTQIEHFTYIKFTHASVDLLAITDLRDDQNRVTDFKTAARRKPVTEAHNSIQLSIYAAAYRLDTGQNPSEVRLDTLLKTKASGRQLLISHRADLDYRVLTSRINTTLCAIEHSHFPPCSPDAWVCSDRWCGYWRTCPYVNSERLLKAAEKAK